MANVKTAISLDEKLLRYADDLARNMKVSRSRLFVIAMEELIQRYENQELLKAINEAYHEPIDPEERARVDLMRRHHRKIVEGDW